MPDGSFAMQLVVAEHPVGYVERPVWSNGNSNWAKVVASLDERFSFCHQRRASICEHVALKPMIGPGSDEKIAAIIHGQASRLVSNDLARSLAGAGYHGK